MGLVAKLFMSGRRPLRYLLDTNICIYIINRRPPAVFDHFDGLQANEAGIFSITAAELDFDVLPLP